jgi:hypothetical protein
MSSVRHGKFAEHAVWSLRLQISASGLLPLAPGFTFAPLPDADNDQ